MLVDFVCVLHLMCCYARSYNLYIYKTHSTYAYMINELQNILAPCMLPHCTNLFISPLKTIYIMKHLVEVYGVGFSHLHHSLYLLSKISSSIAEKT